MARMGAETLTIPKAEGGAALDRLLELAERYGMDVETVTEETHLPFGNGELTIFPPLGVSGSNELGLTVLASEQSTMQGLIGQSLAKLQQPTSESMVAMRRISVSGAQEKFPAVIENGIIRISQKCPSLLW